MRSMRIPAKIRIGHFWAGNCVVNTFGRLIATLDPWNLDVGWMLKELG